MHPGGSANKVARTHAAPPGSRARPAPTLEPAAGAGSFKTDRCVAQTPPPRQKSHPPPPHRHTRHSFTPTPPRRRRNRARPQFTELLAVFRTSSEHHQHATQTRRVNFRVSAGGSAAPPRRGRDAAEHVSGCSFDAEISQTRSRFLAMPGIVQNPLWNPAPPGSKPRVERRWI